MLYKAMHKPQSLTSPLPARDQGNRLRPAGLAAINLDNNSLGNEGRKLARSRIRSGYSMYYVVILGIQASLNDSFHTTQQ